MKSFNLIAFTKIERRDILIFKWPWLRSPVFWYNCPHTFHDFIEMGIITPHIILDKIR